VPRLTNSQYLQQRKTLQMDWFQDGAWTFSSLESLDEMELHAYFAPTKDFTDEQAIAHRNDVSRQNPSLPQQAGHAYARALRYLGKRPVPQPSVKASKQRSGTKGGAIAIRTIRNPDPDIKGLAQYLVQLTRKVDE